MSELLRIPLRVVIYREGNEWVAHCLEFDLLGTGDSKKEAIEQLAESISLQIAASVEHNNPANLFNPADGRFHRMFAAGKDVATNDFELQGIHADNVQIERAECREYVASDAVCV